jgi:hypothetical protein
LFFSAVFKAMKVYFNAGSLKRREFVKHIVSSPIVGRKWDVECNNM